MSTPSRSSSSFVAKPARGFQLLRIDGYSSTLDLPGGERITSDAFTVGDRHWCIDYYPNGTDASADSSGAIALYLRLVGTAAAASVASYNYYETKERVRARYKFSLLDLATGAAAYERPEESGVFTFAGLQPAYAPAGGKQGAAGGDIGCGNAAFITRQELEGLIREDRLAIRCDVGVTEVSPLPLADTSLAARLMRQFAPLNNFSSYHNYLGGYPHPRLDDCYLGGLSQRSQQSQEPPPVEDEEEYIRRCLAGGKQSRE